MTPVLLPAARARYAPRTCAPTGTSSSSRRACMLPGCHRAQVAARRTAVLPMSTGRPDDCPDPDSRPQWDISPERHRESRSSSEYEVERSPFVDGAFSPDPAAVPVDDSLHGGQPDPGARKFALAM